MVPTRRKTISAHCLRTMAWCSRTGSWTRPRSSRTPWLTIWRRKTWTSLFSRAAICPDWRTVNYVLTRRNFRNSFKVPVGFLSQINNLDRLLTPSTSKTSCKDPSKETTKSSPFSTCNRKPRITQATTRKPFPYLPSLMACNLEKTKNCRTFKRRCKTT